MTSASEGKEPKKSKPGPKEERLVIDQEDAGEALDRFLCKKPAPEEEGEEKPDK